MIKVLGAKRIMVILALIAINALFAAVVYMYLEPQLKKEERVLRAAKGKENQTRADISNLQLEFDQLEEQQDEFDRLKADGFFSNQSRRQVQQIFLDAEQKSGVVKATVNVKSGSVKEDEEAAKADHVILESPIDITLRSIDDTDVYFYLNYLEQNFPGHITITDLYMRRVANVSDTILRAIIDGAKPGMVEATISLNWQTMVERGDFVDSPDGNAGGL